jgi:hypothetical protein
MPQSNDLLTINLEIRDISAGVNNILNLIAINRGLRKWEIVRLALIEFAERYEAETKG